MILDNKFTIKFFEQEDDYQNQIKTVRYENTSMKELQHG